MRCAAVAAAAALAFAARSRADFCKKDASGGQPDGAQNLYPINDGASSGRLVGTVADGKLFNVTVPMDGADSAAHFPVIHLYGSAAQRGAAYGQILAKYFGGRAVIDEIWAYFESQITDYLPLLPEWLQKLIADKGLDAALGLTYNLTKAYTNPEYFEELDAVAAAVGIDAATLRNINMIPGLTRGSCSMFGAWGDALADKDGVLQLRALDWDMAPAIVNHPVVVVYHTPDRSYATQGIIGLIGAITGVSSEQLAISEIGVSYPDSTFGKMSRVGTPFIFLLRDVLHLDHTLRDSITRMTTARRTCDLILGVGDGKKAGAVAGKPFRGFQYSSSVCNVIDDTNLAPVADWHKPIKDVVYWGMDWICPGYTSKLHDQLQKNYGKLTAEVAIRDVTATETSGGNHLAYYDLTAMKMYLSFAKQAYIPSGPGDAFARQFTLFDLKELFAEPHP